MLRPCMSLRKNQEIRSIGPLLVFLANADKTGTHSRNNREKSETATLTSRARVDRAGPLSNAASPQSPRRRSI
jgi:hypothetical protein